jgi:hypothetical protein
MGAAPFAVVPGEAVEPTPFLALFVLLPLVLAVLCAWAGWEFGKRKGHEWAGLTLGLVLGPIGVLLTALLPTRPNMVRDDRSPDLRRCPHCAELIQRAAIVCRYCQRDVRPVAQPVLLEEEETVWWRFDPDSRP